MDLNFDPDSLTIGEAIELEELTGTSVEDLFNGKSLSMKTLQALVFVILKRDTEVSLEEVSQMKVSQLDFSPKEETSRRSSK